MVQTTPTWTLLLLLLLLLLLAVALGLLLYGWIGRRVGDHPVCRGCGFDLVGKPQTSTVCSECGADLSHSGAVQVGHRVRRRGALWTGAVMLLVSGTALGLIGYAVVQNMDLGPIQAPFLAGAGPVKH